MSGVIRPEITSPDNHADIKNGILASTVTWPELDQRPPPKVVVVGSRDYLLATAFNVRTAVLLGVDAAVYSENPDVFEVYPRVFCIRPGATASLELTTFNKSTLNLQIAAVK